MKNEVYLHRDDLETIMQFMDAFDSPSNVVLITSDNSSGIGSIVKAHMVGVTLNGHVVTVTKDIVDESSW